MTSKLNITGFQPITIYSSFISGRDSDFKTLGKTLSRFGKQNSSAKDFISKFESSGAPFAAAQQLYQESTRGDGTIFFNAWDGTKLPLYSPTRILGGSSISHLAESANATENWIMCAFGQTGLSVNSSSMIYGTSGVYGKNITKIFETIGWSTLARTSNMSLTLNLGFDGTVPSSANPISFSPLIFFFVTILRYLI